MKSMTLPHGDITITISDNYSKESVADFVRTMLVDSSAADRFRADPLPHLRDFGINVSSPSLPHVSHEDLLRGLGLRPSPDLAVAGPARNAVCVVVTAAITPA